MFKRVAETQVCRSPTIAVGGVEMPEPVAAAIRRLSEIRTLPEVARKVRSIAADPEGSIAEMSATLSLDAAMASKILKLANSAFYGLPARVGSIERAIVVLGFKTVQNLALVGSLCGLYREEGIGDCFGGRDLWEHCLGVALASRRIARRSSLGDGEDAFLGGVTHDVGLLAIRDAFPEKLMATINLAATGMSFLEAEQALLDTSHAEVGAALTKVWKFPEFLREICRWHHSPTGANAPFASLVHVVHVADWLCAEKRIGFHLTCYSEPLCRESLDHLKLRAEDLEEIGERLVEELPEAESVFA